MVNLALDVILSEKFETTNNDSNLEERELSPEQSLDIVENLELLFQWDWLLVVIVKTTENMTELNDSNKLLDHILAHSMQNFLEEVSVRVKTESHCKLKLESFPDFMVFSMLGCWLQEDLLLKPVVKLICIFPILTKRTDLDKSWLVTALLGDEEHILLLGVVNK